MKRKTYHYAAMVRADGAVKALCAKGDRPIDLRVADWTVREEAVTCPRCRRALQTDAETAS